MYLYRNPDGKTGVIVLIVFVLDSFIIIIVFV